MLGNILLATLKFSVLYFGIFIPYILALWINFGGADNAKKIKAKGNKRLFLISSAV